MTIQVRAIEKNLNYKLIRSCSTVICISGETPFNAIWENQEKQNMDHEYSVVNGYSPNFLFNLFQIFSN